MVTGFLSGSTKATRLALSLVSLCALVVWPASKVLAEERLENGRFGGSVTWDGPPLAYFADKAGTPGLLEREITRINGDPHLREGIRAFELVVVVIADNAVRNGRLNEDVFDFLTPEQTLQLAAQAEKIDDCTTILTTFDTGEDVAFIVASTEGRQTPLETVSVSDCISEGIDAAATAGRVAP